MVNRLARGRRPGLPRLDPLSPHLAVRPQNPRGIPAGGPEPEGPAPRPGPARLPNT